MAELVDRFSLIHTFWYFEKCSSDQFSYYVIRFKKYIIWDGHSFLFSILVIIVYCFQSIFMCIWYEIGLENGPFWIFEKNQKSLNIFCKNPWLLKNDFLIFGHVKTFVGPCPSFLTLNFLSGASQKGLTVMIAFNC